MIRKILSALAIASLFLGLGANVFAEEAATGSLVVNQIGAVGTVAVAGPSTATVVSASSTIASAAVGSYTIVVTAPSGFVLDSVKDGANAVLATPYTQALVAGATLTYHVNFVASPVTTTSAVTEITKPMIQDKTATCAKMEAGDAKRACIKERNQMKRDFQKQEKAKRLKAIEEAKKKRELAREEAKKKRQALRIQKEAAKAEIVAKDATCDKLEAGTAKDACRVELEALKKTYKDTFHQKYVEPRQPMRNGIGNHKKNGK